MIQIPPNILPWLIGSVVALTFGYRGYSNYRKTKSPLSGYFALIGFTTAASWGLWSVPFLIFPDKGNVMITLILIGDVCNFTMLTLQTRLFWYLNLQKISYWYLGIPAILVSIIGFTYSLILAVNSAPPAIIDNSAVYPISQVTSNAQAVLIVFAILVGLSLIFKSSKVEKGRSKLGTVAIGIFFVGGGTGGMLNVLSSSTQTNDSPVILIAYGIGMTFFFAAFLLFRLKRAKPPKG